MLPEKLTTLRPPVIAPKVVDLAPRADIHDVDDDDRMGLVDGNTPTKHGEVFAFVNVML